MSCLPAPDPDGSGDQLRQRLPPEAVETGAAQPIDAEAFVRPIGTTLAAGRQEAGVGASALGAAPRRERIALETGSHLPRSEAHCQTCIEMSATRTPVPSSLKVSAGRSSHSPP